MIMEVVKMNENLKNKDGEVGYTYIRKKIFNKENTSEEQRLEQSPVSLHESTISISQHLILHSPVRAFIEI